jgi:c-di-GMP-binding flagellar brake protein YcgR
MGEERRKSIRVKTSLFVQYCIDINSVPRKWDITSVKDLSESGVSLHTGVPFEIGSTIALRFKIPSRPFDKTEISAVVVDCKKIEQGSTSMIRAEFKDLSEDTKEVLKDYIVWMVKNPGS